METEFHEIEGLLTDCYYHEDDYGRKYVGVVFFDDEHKEEKTVYINCPDIRDTEDEAVKMFRMCTDGKGHIRKVHVKMGVKLEGRKEETTCQPRIRFIGK